MADQVDARSLVFTVKLVPKSRIVGIWKRFHAGGKAEVTFKFENVGAVDFPGGTLTYIVSYTQPNLMDDCEVELPAIKSHDSYSFSALRSVPYVGAVLFGLTGLSLKAKSETWYLYSRREDGSLRAVPNDGRAHGESEYFQDPREFVIWLATLIITVDSVLHILTLLGL